MLFEAGSLYGLFSAVGFRVPVCAGREFPKHHLFDLGRRHTHDSAEAKQIRENYSVAVVVSPAGAFPGSSPAGAVSAW